MPQAIHISPIDNVVVALHPIATVSYTHLTLPTN